MLTSNDNLAPLLGSWLLRTAETTFVETGEHSDLYGPDPEGRMVLGPGGRIMFIMAKSGRRAPTSDIERVTAFNDMAAYTGIIRSDAPGQFTTTVDLSWNPAWSGEQLRYFSISGDRLTIRTPEQTDPRFPGLTLAGVLVWEREVIGGPP